MIYPGGGIRTSGGRMGGGGVWHKQAPKGGALVTKKQYLTWERKKCGECKSLVESRASKKERG